VAEYRDRLGTVTLRRCSVSVEQAAREVMGPGESEPVWDRQRDHLCGPFVAARILRRHLGRSDLDQDVLAGMAGSTVPAELPAAVPRGASSLGEYRVSLPRAPCEHAGTAPKALGEALRRASKGTLAVVPVAGPWTVTVVKHVLQDVVDLTPGIAVLANLRTGHLWGSRPDPATLVSELTGTTVRGPAPEWDVGHWVELMGVVSGSKSSMVVVHDTYQSLGWGGLHVQPIRVVVEALSRGDGHDGGLIVVVPSAAAVGVEKDLELAGADVSWWDNGTPEPATEEEHGTG